MTTYFDPPRSSTPTVPDLSRSSALSAAELTTLTPGQVEFLDAVIRRAPPSATTFIHIFKAYNDVINERGLDAENEVEYYKRLLKIGTLKGENWASKWRAVKAQNGYTVPPPRAKLPLPKATSTTPKAAPMTPQPQSSTARLLQRLKGLQDERPVEPSESAPDDLFSRTDITDTEADPPPRPAPLLGPGQSLSEFTITNNTLGLDVGPLSSYPPSSTLAASKLTGRRWPERDPDIDKSVPFLTSTPPLSPHKFALRPTPASIRQQVSYPSPITSAPRRTLPNLRSPDQPAMEEDDAWNKIRVAQDEKLADQFRNESLLRQCFDIWRQGYDWITVRSLTSLRWHHRTSLNTIHAYFSQTTTAQVAHAHDTFVLRVAIHKWCAALAQRHERQVRADARANAYRRKAALVRWHMRLQERRKGAWRADMRMRMHTVRSLREAALRRDAWARWRQLYQSRLLQQRFAVRLVERCFERWKGKLPEINSMKGRADEFLAAREGEAAGRCWDSWRRAVELRSAERAIAERVGARVVRKFMAFWHQRTYAIMSPSRASVDLFPQA
jgi:protein SFI1